MSDLTEYATRFLNAVDAEIARQRVTTAPGLSQVFWQPRGSAGAARDWFKEIVRDHPDEVPERIAYLLSERVEMEIAKHSGCWFTRSHLRGVVLLARKTVR